MKIPPCVGLAVWLAAVLSAVAVDPQVSNIHAARRALISPREPGPGGGSGGAPVAWGADFDGDGLADPAVYAESAGAWSVLFSAGGYAQASTTFGGTGWVAVARDYDGDGKCDPAVYETGAPSAGSGQAGAWAVMLSSAGYGIARAPGFGGADCVPAPGDFDGDRMADPAVYEASAGAWYVMLSGAGYGIARAMFGGAGWQPAVADYDGDGRCDPALYSETTGQWQVLLSGGGYTVAVLSGFGGAGWQPAVADYDGDTLADPALFDPAVGSWRFRLSASGYAEASLAGFGGEGDTPAAADYDGDRCCDPAFYREPEAMVSVYFSGGNDVPGSFQETNLLHVGATLGSVTRAGAQNVGYLYGKRPPGASSSSCWFQVISRAGVVLRDEEVFYNSTRFPAAAAAVLTVDAAGEPQILTGFYSRNILRLYRSGAGWTNEVIGTREAGESDILACMDARGALHVVTTSLDLDNNSAGIHYYSNRGGAWQKENLTLPLPAAPAKWYQWGKDLVADADGNAHLALSFQHHPSDDVTWPGWIYYLSNRGGAWFAEIAAQQSHGSWDSFFPKLSLAVDAQGRPAIAAWLKYNVLTGSDALSQLIFCRRSAPDSWARETLAETADNYFGSDGGHFTGLYPKLALDNAGGAHIVFSDLASSHVNGEEQAVVGQIRSARNTGTGWTLATLYRQSAADGESVYAKHLLVSGDGQGMDVVARIMPKGGDYIVHFSSIRQSDFYFE